MYDTCFAYLCNNSISAPISLDILSGEGSTGHGRPFENGFQKPCAPVSGHESAPRYSDLGATLKASQTLAGRFQLARPRFACASCLTLPLSLINLPSHM
jgi:hypothetical protein